MNLIENLGGYEAVKVKSESNILYGEKIYLKRALLEYRRQNEIYEIGDFVVYESECKSNKVHEIESLGGNMGI